jgi:hypothetical protein
MTFPGVKKGNCDLGGLEGYQRAVGENLILRKVLK